MRWNLNTKIVAAYLELIVLTAGVLSGAIYWQLQTSQQSALQDRLSGMVGLAAQQLDSDDHALINRPADPRTDYDAINQQKLKNIQASDADILWLYTVLYRQRSYRIVLYYDPEAEASPQERPQVGDTPPELPLTLQHKRAIDTTFTETKISTTQEGKSVLLGDAPIQSQLGCSDGVLVIELDAMSIIQNMRSALWTAGGDAFRAKPINSNELFKLLSKQLGLEWIYETPTAINTTSKNSEHLDHQTNGLAVPPESELQGLLELASSDFVHNLRQQLDQRLTKDSQYVDFVRPLLALAKQFKVEEIESLLEEYLSISIALN